MAKNKGGRPPKWKSVEELNEKILAYFDNCAKEKKPLTITGLANSLDTTRETLLDYEKNKEKFSDTIKKAKSLCEQYVEEQLFIGKNVVGAIFNLKNNYKRWKDKQEMVVQDKRVILDS